MNDDGNHPSPGQRPGHEGSPTILLSDRQDIPVDHSSLTALARACLAGEGRPNVELSVSFVGEDEMTDLHVRYLGEEGPTDVLSFEQDGRDGGMLGDVVICPAYAARTAPGADADVDRELRLLLVHGILHLLGYDHEADDERAVMWARQESYSGVPAS
jgi:probable rRNA maturation factor